MSLLDQAIIDARELREAALRSAEQSILDKYAPEVRKAVDSMLSEQEDMMGGEAPEPKTSIDAPLAAAEGEKLCPCPEEDEEAEIEIDFAELEDMADEGEAAPMDDLAMDMGAEAEPEEEEDVLALQEELNEEEEAFELSEEDVKELRMELDEEELNDLYEKLVTDLGHTKSGWFPHGPTQTKYALELELARQQGDEAQEELEATKAALDRMEEQTTKMISKLKKQNSQHSQTISEMEEKNTQYSNVILDMEGKINELLLINSRLLYANRVMESVSLNERQKKHLVEAISKARSPEEAKTIFESLQNVVGSVPVNRKQPKSLRESIQKPFTIYASRKESGVQDDMKSRMQQLAGITNEFDN